MIILQGLFAMDKEQRKGMNPVPDNIEELLNEAQLRTLLGIRQFGWELFFVRRPLFQDAIPVLINRDANKTIVLEVNGSINENPDIDIRECVPAAEHLKKAAG